MVKNRGEKRNLPDLTLLSIISLLIAWGLLSVGTISFAHSLQSYETPWVYLFHQVLMLFIGIALGIIVFKVPLEKLKKYSYILFFFNLLLVILVFLPKIGVEIGGAKRWLNFGWTLFQPSELLKISFVLYLAAWLTGKSNSEEKSKKSLFLHFSIILIILVLVLIFQPDMSTLAIILITGGIMYFASKVPWWHVITIIGVGFSGAMLLIKISPYRLNRLFVFLNPEADPMGMGYQLKQSLIAIGSGKIFGIENGFGLGLSRQKFGFLPHPMNDSIFAIIGEELGFIGLIILLSLFLFFIWKGLNIAKKSEDNFCKLAAIGITSWIALQTMFNIGGIIGIMPMSGIPLPFFSYGGSHLITEMIGMGILLNISKNVVK